MKRTLTITTFLAATATVLPVIAQSLPSETDASYTSPQGVIDLLQQGSASSAPLFSLPSSSAGMESSPGAASSVGLFEFGDDPFDTGVASSVPRVMEFQESTSRPTGLPATGGGGLAR